ncbi:unnamed protein product [Leuciscus chuanchicus]
MSSPVRLFNTLYPDARLGTSTPQSWTVKDLVFEWNCIWPSSESAPPTSSWPRPLHLPLSNENAATDTLLCFRGDLQDSSTARTDVLRVGVCRSACGSSRTQTQPELQTPAHTEGLNPDQ